MRNAIRVMTLAAMLAAAGCSAYKTYTGPARPASRLAILDVPGRVLTVDGVAVDDEAARRLAILPGWHEVEWRFTYPNGYTTTKRIAFVAQAPNRYRLGQRFFPEPNPAGFFGDVFDFAMGAAFFPIKLMIPDEDATEAPAGEYFSWVMERDSRKIVAGLAPDVPMPHDAITYLPLEADEEDPSTLASGDE